MSKAMPFGRESRGLLIKCLGCKRQFGDWPEYNAHQCPEPHSGEAYR